MAANPFKKVISWFTPKSRDTSLESYVRGLNLTKWEDWKTFFGLTDDVIVNENTAMTLSVVFAAVMAKGSDFGLMPWHVKRIEGGKKVLAPDHHQYYLLKTEPHPFYSSYSWRRDMSVFRDIWGNAFAKIVRNERSGRPEAYEIRHPAHIESYVDEEGMKWHRDLRLGETISDSDMIHWMAWSPDGISGVGIVDKLEDVIRSGIANNRFEAKFWENGARPSGWVERDAPFRDDAARRKYIESFQREYGGSAKAGKTIFMPPGAKYHALTFKQSESQQQESKKFNVEELARVLDMPVHRIGHHSDMSYNNITQLSIEYTKFHLAAHAVALEQEFDRKVFNSSADRGRVFNKVELKGLMRGDVKERTEFYRTMLAFGVFSINDVLTLEDMNPVDNDVRLLPLNMIPADLADEYYSNLAAGNGERIYEMVRATQNKTNGRENITHTW